MTNIQAYTKTEIELLWNVKSLEMLLKFTCPTLLEQLYLSLLQILVNYDLKPGIHKNQTYNGIMGKISNNWPKHYAFPCDLFSGRSAH